MKLLNIKIIMGLIVATSMGFLPPLCASSLLPSQQDAILDAALNEFFGQPHAAVQATAASTVHATDHAVAAQQEVHHARYCFPATNNHWTNRWKRFLAERQIASTPIELTDVDLFFIYISTVGIGVMPLLGRIIDQTVLGSNVSGRDYGEAAFCTIVTLTLGIPFMKRMAYAIKYINGLPTNTYHWVVANLVNLLASLKPITIPHHAPILQADCTICHEPLLDDPVVPQQPIFATNCNAEAPAGNAHLFHKSCLQAWFDRRKAQVADLDLLGRVAFGAIQQCPTCRTEVADPGLVTITAPDNQPAAQPAHAHTD
jgi:hypothetical protein